jgi:predicted glutamine amidotransferase
MCGIFGFVNGGYRYMPKAKKLIEELTIVDVLRGSDGTGMAVLPEKRDELIVYKRGLWGPEFLTSNGYQKTLAPFISDARMVIGHNRAASSNNLGDHRAHPFTNRHITLVHNGYINNAWGITPKGFGPDVDSEAAAYAIAEHGAQAGLEKLKGAFALVWYDSKERTLNIARNEGREMVLAFIKDSNVVWWASEMDMLWLVLNRNDVKMDGLFKIVPTYVHLKFPVDDPRSFSRHPFMRPQNQTSSTDALWENRGHSQLSDWKDRSMISNTETSGSGTSSKSTATGGSDAPRGAPQSGSEHWLSLGDKELSELITQFNGLNKDAKRGSGIPTSKGKIKAIFLKVAKYGARLGQQILLKPEAFDLHTNQREFGTVRASRTHNPTIPVQIPWVSATEWAEMQRASAVYGIVVNIKINKKIGKTVLVCALHSVITRQKLTGYHGGILTPVPRKEDSRPTLTLVSEHAQAEAEATVDPWRSKEAKTTVYVQGPGGSMITEQDFVDKTARHGCGHCGLFVDPKTAHQVRWVGESAICAVCCGEEEVQNEYFGGKISAVH